MYVLFCIYTQNKLMREDVEAEGGKVILGGE